MVELVRVREVATVPGYQEVTPMEGGKRQVQRIAQRIGRHDLVRDVGFYDLGNRGLDGYKGQLVHEMQTVLAVCEVTLGEFVHDRRGW